LTSGPSSVRSVRFPAGYGTPGGPDTWLPWSYVEARMQAAANYWITTLDPDTRPHARPVDGVWVDGALCFGGSPETRWVRNLMANASISVHLSGEAEAIFAWTLEGFPRGATRWQFEKA
jgi:Pyridoxamine 5'-phosphate oxidase